MSTSYGELIRSFLTKGLLAITEEYVTSRRDQTALDIEYVATLAAVEELESNQCPADHATNIVALYARIAELDQQLIDAVGVLNERTIELRVRAELAEELLQGIRDVCDSTGGEFYEGAEIELSDRLRALTRAQGDESSASA